MQLGRSLARRGPPFFGQRTSSGDLQRSARLLCLDHGQDKADHDRDAAKVEQCGCEYGTDGPDEERKGRHGNSKTNSDEPFERSGFFHGGASAKVRVARRALRPGQLTAAMPANDEIVIITFADAVAFRAPRSHGEGSIGLVVPAWSQAPALLRRAALGDHPSSLSRQ